VPETVSRARPSGRLLVSGTPCVTVRGCAPTPARSQSATAAIIQANCVQLEHQPKAHRNEPRAALDATICRIAGARDVVVARLELIPPIVLVVVHVLHSVDAR
jgi:hypothetical protein